MGVIFEHKELFLNAGKDTTSIRYSIQENTILQEVKAINVSEISYIVFDGEDFKPLVLPLYLKKGTDIVFKYKRRVAQEGLVATGYGREVDQEALVNMLWDKVATLEKELKEQKQPIGIVFDPANPRSVMQVDGYRLTSGR